MVHVRIVGRTLRPGCINTRRLFLGILGVDVIRVPRSANPFSLARRIRRYLQHEDIVFLKKLVSARRRPMRSVTPDVAAAEPVADEEHAAAAE